MGLKLFLSQKLTSWEKNLQEVLETPVVLDHQQLAPQFQATTDIGKLCDTLQFLPENVTDRMVHVFSRITPYFDSGVLLYQVGVEDEKVELWSPGAAFNQGKYHALPIELLDLRLRLPRLNFLELRKTSAHNILQQLPMPEIGDSVDTTAFAFKVDVDFIYLLFTEMPEPWLRQHMENIYRVLCQGLAR